MKKVLFLFVFGSKFLFAQTPATNPLGWDLIVPLSDEFNSGSSPNTSLWHNGHPPGGDAIRGDEEAVYRTTNALVGPSLDASCNVLKLIAEKETNVFNSNTYYFQQAALLSKTSFKYGYYEIRCKLPSNWNYSFPTFWFVGFGGAGASQTYGEIDVFEIVGNRANRLPVALHYGPCPSGGTCNGYLYGRGTSEDRIDRSPFDFSQDFHKFGLDWQPDHISIFLDDKLYTNYTYLHSGLLTVPINVMDQKMTLWLWNEIAATQWGTLTNASNPFENHFEIDYFHYYKEAPKIELIAYDCTTKIATYKASTSSNQNSFQYSIDYPSRVDIISVDYSHPDYFLISLKIKAAYESLRPAPLLTVFANQTLDQSEPATTYNAQSSSQISLKMHNPEFTLGDQTYYNNKVKVQAFAVCDPSFTSKWQIAKKNLDNTLDWSVPQTQYGLTGTFIDLTPNQAYVIKHIEYGPCTTTETTQEIYAKFNSEFTWDYTYWNTNTMLKVTAQDQTGFSRWDIAIKNPDNTLGPWSQLNQGNYSPVFGNLLPGNNYVVRYRRYDSFGTPATVSETQKTIWVELYADFDLYNPGVHLDSLNDDDDMCTDQLHWGSPKISLHYSGSNLCLDAFSLAMSGNYANYWYLYSVNPNGTMGTLLQGPLSGNNVTFCTGLVMGNHYVVKHGVTDQNGHWVEVKKIVKITPEKMCDFGRFVETSDEDIHEKMLNVYPNPNSGEFTVKFTSAKEVSGNMYLMNLSGQIIYTRTISLHEGDNQFIIEKSDLSSGIYFMKIDGIDYTSKIIISK